MLAVKERDGYFRPGQNRYSMPKKRRVEIICRVNSDNDNTFWNTLSPRDGFRLALKRNRAHCSQLGCVIMHWTCPACTTHAGDGSLKLTDDRFTKDDILAVLDKVRKRDAAAMDETLDRMHNALGSFVQEMTTTAREAARWYR